MDLCIDRPMSENVGELRGSSEQFVLVRCRSEKLSFFRKLIFIFVFHTFAD